MKSINKLSIILSLAVALVFVGCKPEEEFSEDKVKIDFEQSNSQFDKYLKKNFIDTYNIEILYKWKDIESDLNYTLTPASYENSVKMANVLKYVCLDAYDAVAPEGFLKKYFPKMVMFVGSLAYNSSGSIVLGTAEGGLKITLYGVSHLNTSNVELMNQLYFHTIIHEFSHILHQTIDFSTDYKKITSTEFLGDAWTERENTSEVALKKGFVSPYSRKDFNEDFVEVISHYVTNTDAQWSQKMATAGASGAQGRAIIERKVEMIRTYLKNFWSIDLDALRAEFQTRLKNVGDPTKVDLDNIDL